MGNEWADRRREGSIAGYHCSYIREQCDYSRQRAYFNEATVEAVEDALIRLADCNEWMKELLTDVVSGGRLAARGWLRKALKKTHKALTKDKSRWNGAGCRNFIRAFRRSEIESTFQ